MTFPFARRAARSGSFRGKAMYGDLVNAICYSMFVPVYAGMWLSSETCSLKNDKGPLHVNSAFLWTAIMCWTSYLKTSAAASTLALLGMCVSITSMNLYRWPHADDPIVVPQFLWCLLVISANGVLPFWLKATHGGLALVTAVVVALLSPLHEASDCLPILVGSAVVFFLFHYSSAVKGGGHAISARTASLVLAGSFAYHTAEQMVKICTIPGYGQTGGFNILKAGFFGAIGLASAGAFQQEINIKEQLEVLVEERTKRIREQNKHLRVVGMALEASETAVAICSSKGQEITWSNPALERLTGIKAKQLKKKSLLDVLLGEEDSEEKSRLLHCFEEGNHGDTHEIQIHSKYLRVELSSFEGSVGEEEDDSKSSFLVVLKDVTEQKARQAAEKSAEREALIAQAMNDSMQTLSHELRTPLQGIMGIASVLLDDATLSGSVLESMSMVMTSARLLLTLINNMLDIRKCDAHLLDSFELAPMPVQSALKESVHMSMPYASITEVKLEVAPESTLSNPQVQGNALRVQQVMTNLISNAIRYTKRGTTVSVHQEIMPLSKAQALMDSAVAASPLPEGQEEEEKESGSMSGEQSDEEPDVVVISVMDQGPGVSQGQAEKIFGTFGRPSNNNLGLDLCQKFVHRMKGSIWVENLERTITMTENGEEVSGGGACFSFYLPKVKAAPQASQATVLQEIAQRRMNSRRITFAEKCRLTTVPFTVSLGQVARRGPAGYRVLVVDDLLINLKVLHRMLTRVGVVNITTVQSGSQALEALLSNDTHENGFYNLVMTDIQMPEMSGTQLSKRIRSVLQERRRPMPTIVGLTADVSDKVRDDCLNSGMVRVLHKPLTFDHLQDFFEKMDCSRELPRTA